MNEPSMQEYFYALGDELGAGLEDGERYFCSYRGERSDFVRLSRNRIRQAGSVDQHEMRLELIAGKRHAGGGLTLSKNADEDRERIRQMMADLRARRACLPEDPHLNYATETRDSSEVRAAPLPDSATALRHIMYTAGELDLVGIWAAGSIERGFANSFGQRNWFRGASFNFDWSVHHAADRALKGSYAGLAWQPEEFDRQLTAARRRLALLARTPRTLRPGRYRTYLAPAALAEILRMLAWGGFSLASHRTQQSPLVKLGRGERRLHPAVSLTENRAQGLTPGFTTAGFIKPERVALIRDGAFAEYLVGARSAREYGVAANAEEETPESAVMAAGDVPANEVLARLDTGLYLGNLWYCNFSDRNECRITGMTRFGSFWVEGGELRAPIPAMRFDDSAYRMLGEKLIGLTAERTRFFDPHTYGGRSSASMLLPGALLEELTLTL